MLKSVKGFTAIEMAIVLSVSALVMGGGLAASKPVIEKMQKQKTERQMEKINDRLASYVHRNNRLPCPADPSVSAGFGSEMSSCTGSDTVGVIPFRDLGLSEKDIRDSWGNFISYHVSPVFSVHASDVADTDHDIIHEFCRSDDWVTDPFVESDPEIPDDLPYWSLKDNFNSNAALQTELLSPDSKIRLTTEDGAQFTKYFKNESDGSTTYRDSVGIVDSSGGGYSGIRPGENPIINFDHPAESFTIKLTELKNEINTNITFQLWGSPDAEPDDYVEISVDLTQEFLDTHVNLWDSEELKLNGYTHFMFNPETLTGHPDYKVPFEVPGIDKIYKVRILNSDGTKSDGTTEHMSYDIYSLPEVKYAAVGDVPNPLNVNPAKARFCCPMKDVAGYTPSTDLRIVDESGRSIVSQSRSTDNADYADKDVEVEGSVSSDIFAPAFALISHGPNGHGAYQGNSSGNRISVSGTVGQGFGSDEASNADGDRTYVYRMPDMSEDASYYDDIVMWRTQDQIYSEFGNQSCQTP